MGIEEEIKQRQFVSEQQRAVVNLIFTHNWFKERISLYLKKFGITPQQYNVLRILNGQYPNGITTGEVRNRMLDRMSDASRLADRLEGMKLVEKARNKQDRRLVVVLITQKGRDLVNQIRKEEKEFYKPIEKSLSPEEAVRLSELLDKMRG